MGRLPLIDWGLAVFSRGGSSFPLGLWFNLHSFETQAGRTRNLVQNRTTLTAVIVVDRVHPQQPTGKSTPFPICATHGSGFKHQKPRRKSSRIQSHRCLKTGARGLDVNSRRTNSGTGAGPAWVNWRGAQGAYPEAGDREGSHVTTGRNKKPKPAPYPFSLRPLPLSSPGLSLTRVYDDRLVWTTEPGRAIRGSTPTEHSRSRFSHRILRFLRQQLLACQAD